MTCTPSISFTALLSTNTCSSTHNISKNSLFDEKLTFAARSPMQFAHPARPSGAPYIESPRRSIHKINKSQCLLRSLICCALTSNAARRAALGAPPADAPPPTPPPPACKARKLMATRKCHGLAREIPVSDTLRSPGAVFSATRPCRWARTWQRARRPGSRRACPRPACAHGLARGSAT